MVLRKELDFLGIKLKIQIFEMEQSSKPTKGNLEFV